METLNFGPLSESPIRRIDDDDDDDNEQPQDEEFSSSLRHINNNNNNNDLHLDRTNNVSRDDSDVGGEYFLRGGGGTAAAALAAGTPSSLDPAGWDVGVVPAADADGRSASSSATTTEASVLRSSRTPPRIMSSNSLYGEAILVGRGGSSGGCAPPPSFLMGEQQPSSVIEEQQHQQQQQLSYLNSPPFLKPQFRGHEEEDDELGSVSEDSSVYEENLIFPSNLLVSPGTSECTTPPPPSVQYSRSLSPPPLVNDELRPQQLALLLNHHHNCSNTTNNNTSSSSIIRESLVDSSSQASRAAAAAAAAVMQQKQRPPLAPTFTLRFQGGGGGSSNNNNNNNSSNPNNVSSSISSIVAYNNAENNDHNRVHSSGDASFLSALTDSDYEGVGGGDRSLGVCTANMLFRESASGRGGGSSSHSSGAIQTTTMMMMQQQQQNYLPDRSGAASYWDPEGVVAQQQREDVRGMNIDIPSCLQQPFLGEDDSHGVEVDDIMEMSDSRSLDGGETTESRSPSFRSSGPQRTNRGSGDQLSVFEESASAPYHHHHHHHERLPNLCELETKVEAALMVAIEDEPTNTSSCKVDDRQNALPPNASHDDDAEIRLRMAPDTHSFEAAVDGWDSKADADQSTAFTQWISIQNANQGVAFTSHVIREGDKEVPTHLGALDLFLNNAMVFMAATQQLKASSPRAESAPAAMKSIPTPMAGADGRVVDRDVGDAALDDAETVQREPVPVFHNITNAAMKCSMEVKATFDCYVRQIKAELTLLLDFFRPQKKTQIRYLKNLLKFVVIPSLCVASLLFYVFDIPPTGKMSPNDKAIGKQQASLSWWVIFLGVRHPLVWSFARGLEFGFSGFFGVTGPRFAKLVGPRVGLLFAQSRGWPGVLIFYGSLCFVLLYGNTAHANHWLFWQDFFDIFTTRNPAGDITTRVGYFRSLIVCIVVGILVSFKRVWLGYHLGRRLCVRYSEDLRFLMEKLVLLSEVASLSVLPPAPSFKLDLDDLSENASPMSTDETQDISTNAWEESSRLEIIGQLEEWNEPFESKVAGDERVASFKDILEFREMVLLLRTEFPFSRLFGRANTRAMCVESSAVVYDRLLGRQSARVALHFATLKVIAINGDGTIDRAKMKRLIQLFRPNKDKVLTLLDFTKSVDCVYRELRTLSACISNAIAIEKVYESTLNYAFYTALMFISLAVLGLDTLTFGLSVATAAIAVSFVIGSASSAIFEGLLMILVHRPFDIGDRIVVLSNVVDDVPNNPALSRGWIVEDIGLLHTTVRFGGSREVTPVSNGILARSRIINATRHSKNAQRMTDYDYEDGAGGSMRGTLLRASGGRCCEGVGGGSSSSSGAIQQHLPDRSGVWDTDENAQQQQPSEDVRGMNIDFSGCQLQQQYLGAEDGDGVRLDAIEVKSNGSFDGQEPLADGIVLKQCEPQKTR